MTRLLPWSPPCKPILHFQDLFLVTSVAEILTTPATGGATLNAPTEGKENGCALCVGSRSGKGAMGSSSRSCLTVLWNAAARHHLFFSFLLLLAEQPCGSTCGSTAARSLTSVLSVAKVSATRAHTGWSEEIRVPFLALNGDFFCFCFFEQAPLENAPQWQALRVWPMREDLYTPRSPNQTSENALWYDRSPSKRQLYFMVILKTWQNGAWKLILGK